VFSAERADGATSCNGMLPATTTLSMVPLRVSGYSGIGRIREGGRVSSLAVYPSLFMWAREAATGRSRGCQECPKTNSQFEKRTLPAFGAIFL
jgi:hypothetical protein